ncbi:MAG: hypothetical protein ABR601_10890 [Parasphingopyxis sp.]|nr:hypothetical protein [Sphingomonadales bacterium]
MLNIVSLLVGVIAACLMLPGLIPFFGWINWLMLPVAAFGILLGVLSRSNAGRNFNIVIFVIGVIRLMLGGGIF